MDDLQIIKLQLARYTNSLYFHLYSDSDEFILSVNIYNNVNNNVIYFSDNMDNISLELPYNTPARQWVPIIKLTKHYWNELEWLKSQTIDAAKKLNSKATFSR